MRDRQFASVWDAIEDMPAKAENMKLRSILMTALRDHMKNGNEPAASREALRVT